jgi:hypothetical protein
MFVNDLCETGRVHNGSAPPHLLDIGLDIRNTRICFSSFYGNLHAIALTLALFSWITQSFAHIDSKSRFAELSRSVGSIQRSQIIMDSPSVPDSGLFVMPLIVQIRKINFDSSGRPTLSNPSSEHGHSTISGKSGSGQDEAILLSDVWSITSKISECTDVQVFFPCHSAYRRTEMDMWQHGRAFELLAVAVLTSGFAGRAGAHFTDAADGARA